MRNDREESWTSNNEDDGALSFPSYFIAEDVCNLYIHYQNMCGVSRRSLLILVILSL